MKKFDSKYPCEKACKEANYNGFCKGYDEGYDDGFNDGQSLIKRILMWKDKKTLIPNLFFLFLKFVLLLLFVSLIRGCF